MTSASPTDDHAPTLENLLGDDDWDQPLRRKNEEDILTISTESWEGPLDVLLALARTQKVDLREISILALVGQYLKFIDEARALRLELAADYLVMAAWLAYLKSALLLPKEEKGASGGSFRIPYISSRFIIPALLLVAGIAFRHQLAERLTFANGWTDVREAIPFIIFLIATAILAVQCVIRKLSLIPILGLLCCLYLMTEIGARNWEVFGVWLVIGLTIYFGYSRKNSKLAKGPVVAKVDHLA